MKKNEKIINVNITEKQRNEITARLFELFCRLDKTILDDNLQYELDLYNLLIPEKENHLTLTDMRIHLE